MIKGYDNSFLFIKFSFFQNLVTDNRWLGGCFVVVCTTPCRVVPAIRLLGHEIFTK